MSTNWTNYDIFVNFFVAILSFLMEFEKWKYNYRNFSQTMSCGHWLKSILCQCIELMLMFNVIEWLNNSCLRKCDCCIINSSKPLNHNWMCLIIWHDSCGGKPHELTSNFPLIFRNDEQAHAPNWNPFLTNPLLENVI